MPRRRWTRSWNCHSSVATPHLRCVKHTQLQARMHTHHLYVQEKQYLVDQVKLVKQHGGRVKVCLRITLYACVHRSHACLPPGFFDIYWKRLKARGVHLAQPHRRFYDWVRKAKMTGDKVRSKNARVSVSRCVCLRDVCVQYVCVQYACVRYGCVTCVCDVCVCVRYACVICVCAMCVCSRLLMDPMDPNGPNGS